MQYKLTDNETKSVRDESSMR